MKRVYELDELKVGYESFSVSSIQIQISEQETEDAVVLTGFKSTEGMPLVVVCPKLKIAVQLESGVQEPRYNFSVSSFENKIVMTGGEKGTGPRNVLLNSCELLEFTYSKAQGSFSVSCKPFTSLNEERNLHGSYITKENGVSKYLYVLGGKIQRN